MQIYSFVYRRSKALEASSVANLRHVRSRARSERQQRRARRCCARYKQVCGSFLCAKAGYAGVRVGESLCEPACLVSLYTCVCRGESRIQAPPAAPPALAEAEAPQKDDMPLVDAVAVHVAAAASEDALHNADETGGNSQTYFQNPTFLFKSLYAYLIALTCPLLHSRSIAPPFAAAERWRSARGVLSGCVGGVQRGCGHERIRASSWHLLVAACRQKLLCDLAAQH